MKNKYLLPFALTTLMAALTGCGGESANVIPEVYEGSTTNGTCTIGSTGCLGFALDYPLSGLNFTCSSDTKNSFVTTLDLNDGAATGACKVGDKITFFIKGEKEKQINLGTLDLNKIAKVSTSQLPRLTILDIASGITGASATSLDANDRTVKVAMRLAKILQALALQNGRIADPTDIQTLYITDLMRVDLERISQSISQDIFMNTTDLEFESLINPWINISNISNEQAFSAVSMLMNISNAGVYQPEFSLFSTSGVISSLSGSDGLVGCNQDICNTQDSSTQHLFGHFMLITDRDGYTFGSGMQWRGPGISNTSTIGGLNTKLITTTRPIRMTANAQDHWINSVTKKIDRNFDFQVDQVTTPLSIYQGTLYNDYMIAGKEQFYKLLTGKTEVTAADKLDFGLWTQTIGSENFKGTLDLYKTFPITYLDKSVFKSVNNVKPGETYIFPMYANLTFKFTDTSVKDVVLGIVIDEKGNIRTNIKPGSTEDDMSTASCDTNTFNSSTYVNDGVQQYRIGTVSRAFTNNKSISLRMVLANANLKKIDGALVGMNTNIKTSSSGDSIVVGGALLNIIDLLNLTSGKTEVVFKDSEGANVKWANSLSSFQKVYNTNNSSHTSQDADLAKLSGGSLTFALAPCYTVKTK
ncbi:hypothetical protein [Acinetobacter sp.]|uniref:putative pilus system protein FilF n=1 Tax=Acinetobacter sp. TaxID=472 RepID=UPI0028AFB23E|nr:hypothetical protein [Acinetobacter sp.]